jgi:hypothetical protein
MDEKKCPNECGDLENVRGHIETNDGRTYFKVDILYCPDCHYIQNVDANL